jgi:hypothetical protein
MKQYEAYIEGTAEGVVDIDIEPDGEDNTADGGVTITVKFVVTTGSIGNVTINSDGEIKAAFGGIGATDQEIHEYIRHAVDLRAQITGETDRQYTLERKFSPSIDSENSQQKV